jgi:hypothetical protein
VGKEQDVEARSKVFGEAVEAMEGLIVSGTGGICAKIMEQYFNYAVDWDEFEILQ